MRGIRSSTAIGVETFILGLDLVEESARYVAELVAGAGAGEPIHRRDIQAHRDRAVGARVPSRHPDVTITDRSVSVGAHSVGLRQFMPAGPPRGGYLHFHGGGWVFGAAADHDAELSELSHKLGIAVFGVEYRLAPEHPFPAALDDAEAAARWLAQDGLHALDLGEVAIGGASAGAHLAVIALQRLVASGEPDGYCAVNLDYGIYDLSMTPSQRLAQDTPRLSRADLEWYYERATPFVAAEDRRTAAVSPLYGDLDGMPPARFTVGTLDPLFDDSAFMAARWAATGAPATLEIYEQGTHGFARQPNGLGILARERTSAFLTRCLELDT